MSASVTTDNVPMAPPPNSPVDGLTAGLGTLNLVESNQNGLPFSPPDGFRRSAIPRYLFRVYAPKTAGRTTPDRVESVSVVAGAASSRTCLFDLDESTAADMVDKHLRWGETSIPDNLVSWTSSLWTALVYIFYRHAHDHALFGDIYLYIVDTSKFSDKTFMSDLDLICALMHHDTSLVNFWNLRHQRRGEGWSGSYYFGEYLTQGSLSLEGKCARVTAKEMMNNGLPELQPCFDEFAGWDRNEAGWAKFVVELREPFYRPPAEDVGDRRVGPNDNDASIMRRIGKLFGVGWRAPVALALFSLAPNRTGAVDLLFGFENDGPPWDPRQEKCLDPAIDVNPDNMAPEVEVFIYHLNDAQLEFLELALQRYIDRMLEETAMVQRLIQKAEAIQQSPRDVARAKRRLRLSNFVRTMQDEAQNISGDDNVARESASRADKNSETADEDD